MKRRIKIYNILGYVFIFLQLASYAGSTSEKVDYVSVYEKVGYYVGYNILLIVAIIFFISARELKKKIKAEENQKSI